MIRFVTWIAISRLSLLTTFDGYRFTVQLKKEYLKHSNFDVQFTYSNYINT